MAVSKLVYSVEEFAQTFGVSVPSVHNYIASGSLPVVRMGKRVLISAEVVSQIVRGERQVFSVKQAAHSQTLR